MMHALDPVAEEDELPAASSSSATPAASSGASQRAHARQHSRIHERNLSAFFPRPGNRAEGYGAMYDDPHARRPFVAPTTTLPSSASSPSGPFQTPPKSVQGRRGHHHRHSVSHNLFPFLDSPTGTDASGASPVKHPHTPTKAVEDQLPAPSASFRQRYGHLPLPIRLVLYSALHLPPSLRGLVALACAQIVVGAALWVRGQAGESLATTGLGYVVVFDGIGALSCALLERGEGYESLLQALTSLKDSSVRKPYGSARLVTLSHFSQAVYLLFSAVYVCKESIEHVLLLHGPQEASGAHGSGHGGVGHGEGLATIGDGHDAIALPRMALLACALLSTFLALFLHNHDGLARAIRRPAQSAPSGGREHGVEPAGSGSSSIDRLLNPFSLTVITFAVALLGASLVLPSAQLASVDKVLALVESVAIFYVAQPAASETGRLEALPSVADLDPPHLWQLSTTTSASSPSLIATVSLALHAHASTDAEVLDVTRWVHERVQRLNQRLGERGAGEGKLEGVEMVDVTVQVRKGT
ncbi:hypothetical protein Rhopal_005890-T1 [Rhodotorula paludigena]|uniref:Cation efflux protein transmembrane domain-containing protein n=1 Tax=Rhodotorula paludigena TaxID=86838 RepID=A0AAV5GTM2_9BASI|nr:hypothetical protein Rhopal_005890-T1 [Rhodotorula paludigena]